MNNNRKTVAKFEKETGIHFTTKHTGKMEGMYSLSTSCLLNPYCRKYAKDPNKVCHYCFAERQMKYQKSMQPCFERNTKILTTRIVPIKDWPHINHIYLRGESFGDAQNEIQVENYFNCAEANSHLTMSVWTKNPFIYAKVLERRPKPKNLILIYSSPFLNDEAKWVLEKYPFVDKIFTVYTKEYIKAHGIKINCGGRSCLTCGRCYSKRTGKFVREEKK